MGLRYSFELFLDVAQVDPMLRAVCRHLAPKDREVLENALPWCAEIDRMAPWPGGPPARHRRGIRGLKQEDYERLGNYCLSFEFPTDGALAEYEAYQAGPMPPPCNKMVPVGCVWSDLSAGEEFAVLDATAATSGMGRLFQESPNIRAAWRGIAEAGDARALFFSFEGEHWELLYPKTSLYPFPDQDRFMLEDEADWSVDAYAEEALRLASLA